MMTLTVEPTQSSAYLGPARVELVAGNRVRLAFPDQQVWAVPALASPYQVVSGDQVLAIGQDENWYVIGVLKGNGKMSLTAPADLELRAPRGRIELTAAKGIRLRSPSVKVVADKLEMLARSLYERCANATQWISESLQVRAGRLRTAVESTYRVKANRIVERAEGDVKIDGRKIHLG
jgi:hypothetical protein